VTPVPFCHTVYELQPLVKELKIEGKAMIQTAILISLNEAPKKLPLCADFLPPIEQRG
jgi:hypothetical protein